MSTMYVGAWNNNETPGGADGLWAYRFDEATGAVAALGEVPHTVDAGAKRGRRIRVGASLVDPERRMYYATDERHDAIDGRAGGGRIVSYEIGDDGVPSFRSSQWSMGPQPSYLCFDESRRFILCSLMGWSGSALRTSRGPSGWTATISPWETATVLFELEADGTVGPALDLIQHGGEVLEPVGTAGDGIGGFARPNPHSVQRAPGRNLFLTCDKGRDRFTWFRVDAERKALVHLATVDQVVEGRTGLGCRYTAWHRTRDVVYVNNEKAPLITVWSYDDDGGMRLLQSISPFDAATDAAIVAARQADPDVKFEQQDLRLSADGRHLYGLSRCAAEFDSVFEAVSVFDVQADGTLVRTQTHFLEGGALWPRGAAISPSGRWLVVACVYSQEFLVLEIGPNGRVTQHSRHPNPSAANIAFLPG